MSEQLLSALLDGECDVSEVRALLASPELSPELTARWSRMLLVRDVLGGARLTQDNVTTSDSFCASVMAKLGEMDPVEAIPSTFEAPAHANVHSNVVEMPTRPTTPNLSIRPALRSRIQRRLWQPAAGWAAAASVALVALFASHAWLGGGAIGGGQVAAVAPSTLTGAHQQLASNTDGNRGGLVPVSNRVSADEPTETRWAQLDPDTARELNEYMMEHNSSRAEQGMNGALGYARLAARTADYRSTDESH